LAKLNSDDKETLLIAAAFHDIAFSENPENHEELSAEIASNYLTGKIEDSRISEVVNLILATKLDWKGDKANQLSNLIRDADLSGLASKKYPEYSQNLRMEKSFLFNREIDEEEWLMGNIQFFEQQKFHSTEASKLYKKGKKKNLKALKALYNMKDNKQTIASSKSAQTQLKTALRNHIDLSAIADNKANIMLSVNAIVITVGLPLLVDRITGNQNLMIPAAIIAIASIVSMIFATLATRPIKMMGKTNLDLIPEKKSNLFFFGNFYQMNFEEYESGIKQVIANNDILDNSITRDLFFLGKSLGDKYDRLRICYNVFMIGLVLAVLSFFVIAAISNS